MFDLGFGFPACFCVGSSAFHRKISILDDFGAKRKKEGLPAAKCSTGRTAGSHYETSLIHWAENCFQRS